MSLAAFSLIGSVFPAFFQCTAYPILPLGDPVAKVQMIAASRDFAFDPRFAKLVGVAQAKGNWTGEGWELGAAVDQGRSFKAMLVPSNDDKHHWALDWDIKSGSTQATSSSGVADCRLLDPQKEEQGK